MGRVIYEDGEAKRNRLETLIQKLERSTVIDRSTVLELARMTYWLMDRWCKEHDNGKKKVLPRQPQEELDLPVL